MGIPTLPFSFPDVVKYPLHAVVYLLLIYFVFKEFTGGRECDDLRATLASYAKRIETLEKKNDDLTWAVAVKSGVINELQNQKQDTLKIRSNENVK